MASPVLSCLSTGTAHNARSKAQVPATPGGTAPLPTSSQTDSCLDTVTSVSSESERPLCFKSHHTELQTPETEISVANPSMVLMILFLNRKEVFSGNNLSEARTRFYQRAQCHFGFPFRSRLKTAETRGSRTGSRTPPQRSLPTCLPGRSPRVNSDPSRP